MIELTELGKGGYGPYIVQFATKDQAVEFMKATGKEKEIEFWFAPMLGKSVQGIDATLRKMTRESDVWGNGVIRGWPKATPPFWIMMDRAGAPWATIKLQQGIVTVIPHTDMSNEYSHEINAWLDGSVQATEQTTIDEEEYKKEFGKGKGKGKDKTGKGRGAGTTAIALWKVEIKKSMAPKWPSFAWGTVQNMQQKGKGKGKC